MGENIDMTVIQDAVVEWRADANRLLKIRYCDLVRMLDEHLRVNENSMTQANHARHYPLSRRCDAFLAAVLEKMGYEWTRDTQDSVRWMQWQGRWAKSQRWQMVLTIDDNLHGCPHVEITTSDVVNGFTQTSITIEHPKVVFIIDSESVAVSVESPIGRFRVELGTLYPDPS